MSRMNRGEVMIYASVPYEDKILREARKGASEGASREQSDDCVRIRYGVVLSGRPCALTIEFVAVEPELCTDSA